MNRILLDLTLPDVLFIGSSPQQTAEEAFEKALYLEEGKGDLQEAVALCQQVLKKFPQSRDIAAEAQLHIGLCDEKLGLAEAAKAFQNVIDQFPEQTGAVKAARKKLAIRELATGKTQRLTDKGSWLNSQEFALFSRWSPDSQKVTYSWFLKANYFDLRVVDIREKQPRVLYSQKELEYVHPFDWAPDGKSILTGFFRGGDRIDIGLLFPEDSTVRPSAVWVMENFLPK